MELVVQEVGPGEEGRVAAALAELRPHVGDVAGRLAALRESDGLRVLGAFAGRDRDAIGAATFRVYDNLAFGVVLYVDDLVTLPAARGRGAATALLARCDELARELGCASLQLDSGVGADRQDAHRRYFGHGMRIASYHFSKPV